MKSYQDYLKENYIEFDNYTSILNILDRKALDYRNIFDPFKMDMENISEEEEKKQRVDILNIVFDYLGVAIKSDNKEAQGLIDFIENRYPYQEDSAWGALFVRSVFFHYIDRESITDDALKARVRKIIVNPIKFPQGVLSKDKDGILPCDVLVYRKEKDGKKFMHYAFYLYSNQKTHIVVDINVDKKGEVKGNGIHIIKKKQLFNDPDLLGYYALFTSLGKKRYW